MNFVMDWRKNQHFSHSKPLVFFRVDSTLKTGRSLVRVKSRLTIFDANTTNYISQLTTHNFTSKHMGIQKPGISVYFFLLNPIFLAMTTIGMKLWIGSKLVDRANCPKALLRTAHPGIEITNSEPSPRQEFTVNVPPCFSTTIWQAIDNPNPVP